MAETHLAQLNIARMKAPLNAPIMAGFVAGLDKINALAEAAPGFVWRLEGEAGNATDVQAFSDETLLINLSVWTDIEALRTFSYKTEHVDYLHRRKDWFDRPTGAHLVLWWIPAGHRPTVAEAKERLAFLNTHGETAHAFTFRSAFSPDA